MGDEQVDTDGKTVWVHGHDGTCVGRFSKFGMDLHHHGQTQMASGKQCLDCTHERPDSETWQRFVIGIAEQHDIMVPASARPGWLDE